MKKTKKRSLFMPRAKRQQKVHPKEIDRPDRQAMRQERHMESETQGSESGEVAQENRKGAPPALPHP